MVHLPYSYPAVLYRSRVVNLYSFTIHTILHWELSPALLCMYLSIHFSRLLVTRFFFQAFFRFLRISPPPPPCSSYSTRTSSYLHAFKRLTLTLRLLSVFILWQVSSITVLLFLHSIAQRAHLAYVTYDHKFTKTSVLWILLES